MAAIASATSAAPPLTVVTDAALQKFQQIWDDTQRRIEGCAGNKTLLEAGIFHPVSHYRLLKERNVSKRLTWLVEQNAFVVGYTTSRCFLMLRDRGDITIPHQFLLKEGCTASAALDSLNDSFSLLDSGIVVQLGLCAGLRALFGDDYFNTLFHAESTTRLKLGSDSPLNAFLSPVRGFSLFERGEVVHFAHMPLYSYKHWPNRVAGYTGFCIEGAAARERFSAFGLPTHVINHTRIGRHLYEEFNAEPVGAPRDPSLVGQRTTIAADLRDFRLSAEQIQSLDTRKIPKDLEGLVDRIAAAADKTLEEVEKAFFECGAIRTRHRIHGLLLEKMKSLSAPQAQELLYSTI